MKTEGKWVDMDQLKILSEVREERKRQKGKWGEQNRSPVEWIAILTEEVGEASKEAVDIHFGGGELMTTINRNLDNMREELIQVAAVAVQIVENIDRNRLGYEPEDVFPCTHVKEKTNLLDIHPHSMYEGMRVLVINERKVYELKNGYWYFAFYK